MERKLPDWMLKRKTTLISDDNASSIPELSFNGKINFVNQFYDCCYICEALISRLENVDKLIVGFDMEWPIDWNVSSGVNQDKTALIQICPCDKVCYLFHVTEWENLPKIFLDLISHPKIRLVGLNIHCDLWKLARDFRVSVMPIINHNAIELSCLANEILSINQNWSLDRLTVYTLKKKLNKPSDTRKSNWAVKRLSEDQLKYAATDAYVSLLVYQRLQEIKSEIHSDSSTMKQNNLV